MSYHQAYEKKELKNQLPRVVYNNLIDIGFYKKSIAYLYKDPITRFNKVYYVTLDSESLSSEFINDFVVVETDSIKC